MLRTLAALALLLTLSACDTTVIAPGDDDDGGGDPPGSDPATVTLTLDWGRIFVIGDCEGPFPESNTGDFRFEVSGSSDLDGETRAFSVLNREFAVNSGDDVGVPGTNPTFSLMEGQSGSVTIDFSASESDPTGPDPDLNPSRNSQSHVFDGTRWSNLGDRTIRLGSGDDCRVELRYNASSETS